MDSTHYNPRPCLTKDCEQPALTGAEKCWDHLTDQKGFVDGLNPAQLADTWLVGNDASGRDWSGANLENARLSGANLSGTNLSGSTCTR